MALPKIVSGFTVLPVAYPHSTHIIYARAHASSSKSSKPTFPPDRTLFLVNVPVDATERESRVIFDQNDLDDTELQGDASGSGSDAPDSSMEVDAEENAETRPRKNRKDKKKDEPAPPTVVPLPTSPHRTLRKTGAVAHLVFLDSSSLSKALTPLPKARSWPSSEELRGLARYRALYDEQRPPLDIVKAHADTAMELYEFELAKSRRQSAYRKGEAIVDEDGFTLVTRGGAYGKTLGGGVGVANKQFQATGKTGSKKKKESKEKVSFYAFQKAEKQRKAIMDLKKNFEADKARIEKLKQSRRFKPY
ncbi:ribosomal RNA-processing protein 7-domain-containing protein [Pisolithus orientalis]|uniref:ribosomal RNA-processing protein 7-domain-containing protein n=1 Tax=Pisolithus orientalis TaxID=936130 RepID=UPI00222426B1|nr:ribosomal RNA-processing protein 7-domain-containing protein [Pisolithus orientalis]KAI6028857.1 ribosomal RNA-processing protein 7-domain-containing protein [Pisolithus orientalis]